MHGAPWRNVFVVYSIVGGAVQLDLSKVGGSYSVTWIDQSGGPARAPRQTVPGGRIVTLEPPGTGAGQPWVAWLSRTND